MKLKTLYKRDVSGNIRVWWAETNDKDSWRTHSGVLNGSIITSEWREAYAKSQPTDALQALFEANSETDKKLRLDYKESISDIDIKRPSFIKPMLAHPYPGWAGQCFAQPKLDGIRCLASINGLWSRNNTEFLSSPHIFESLWNYLEDNPNIILDGEFYNHQYHDNFNMIISLARKTKPTLKDLEVSREFLQYHIYDMFDIDKPNLRFEERRAKLFDLGKRNYIYIVDTKLISSSEELDLHYSELLMQGYEGQMIRFNRPYEQKRSSYLLKRKDFIDEEFELLDIESGVGQWSGYAKIATCRSKEGIMFKAGISGAQEYCAALLKNKARYVSVTVKYQALTPDGVPRFPIAEKFWDRDFGRLEARTPEIEPKKLKRDLF
jgi:DNA ligase-1